MPEIPELGKERQEDKTFDSIASSGISGPQETLSQISFFLTHFGYIKQAVYRQQGLLSNEVTLNLFYI